MKQIHKHLIAVSTLLSLMVLAGVQTRLLAGDGPEEDDIQTTLKLTNNSEVDQVMSNLNRKYDARVTHQYQHVFKGGAASIPVSKLGKALDNPALKEVGMDRMFRKSNSGKSKQNASDGAAEKSSTLEGALGRIQAPAGQNGVVDQENIYIAVMDTGISKKLDVNVTDRRNCRKFVGCTSVKRVKKLVKTKKRSRKRLEEYRNAQEEIDRDDAHLQKKIEKYEKKLSETRKELQRLRDTKPEDERKGNLDTPEEPRTLEDLFVTESGHGSAVAGVIAGKKQRRTGVSPGTQLLDLIIANEEGSAYMTDIAQGYEYILEEKSKKDQAIYIANLSYTTDFLKNGQSISFFRNIFSSAQEKGVLTIAPSGNHGERVVGEHGVIAPAAYPEVLTVGAINHRNDRLYETSNIGQDVDLVAPGVEVTTHDEDGKLTEVTGTSYAAGYVTGAAAQFVAGTLDRGLEQSEDANFWSELIASELKSQGIEPPIGGWQGEYGMFSDKKLVRANLQPVKKNASRKSASKNRKLSAAGSSGQGMAETEKDLQYWSQNKAGSGSDAVSASTERRGQSPTRGFLGNVEDFIKQNWTLGLTAGIIAAILLI